MLDLLNKLLIIVFISPILIVILSVILFIIHIQIWYSSLLLVYIGCLSIAAIVVIALARFIVIMKQKPSRSRINHEIIITVLIFFFAALMWIFYTVHTGPSNVNANQCVFPPGFTCVSNQLHANGSLYLQIGQGTGKTIMITGIACTQNSSLVFQNSGSIVYPGVGSNVTIPSGSPAIVATPGATFLGINCTDANGNALTGTVGSVYNGKIYINYTEIDTNRTRIINGTFTTKYEP